MRYRYMTKAERMQYNHRKAEIDRERAERAREYAPRRATIKSEEEPIKGVMDALLEYFDEVEAEKKNKPFVTRVRDKAGNVYNINENGIIDVGKFYGVSTYEWNDTYLKGNDGELYEKLR